MTQTHHFPRLIVTGATGRLGRLLQTAWTHRQMNLPRPVFTSRREGADLRLDGSGPLPNLPDADAVVALWGETSNDRDKLRANCTLAQRSHAVAQAAGARLVLHLSSAAVYGPGVAWSETMPPAPISAYGDSKLKMERIVAEIDASDGGRIRHVCLRLANVVGADSLAPALIGSGPVSLDRFGDGAGPLRAYLAPGCLARVITALVSMEGQDLPSLLNVAAPQPVAMADLVRAAGKQINWRNAPANATQVVTLDTSRLSRLLPDVQLHKSAPDMIADWRRLLRVA